MELQRQRLQAQDAARQQEAAYQGAIQAVEALKEELMAADEEE